MIVFEKVVKRSHFLNPLKNFAEDSALFEYRTDPLTGRNTTIVTGMLGYVAKFMVSDQKQLDILVEKTRIDCPFCPESLGARTPMFTPDFIKEGRLQFGEATVVPNLTGHAERSILVVLSKEHHLKLGQFTPELIFNGFKGGAAYLRRLRETEPDIRYPAFVFNFLPPAGSSILHPHMQVLARDRPFFLVQLTLEKSTDYHRLHGSSYWKDLLEKEQGGERYLFAAHGVDWLVPFAPLRGVSEAQAVVRGKSNLLELDDEHWHGLAEGMSTILRFYEEQGYSSFNAVLMSGPLDEHLDYFDANLRIISRPGVQQTCFTDAWALPYLLWDGEALEEPEKLSERIRQFCLSS